MMIIGGACGVPLTHAKQKGEFRMLHIERMIATYPGPRTSDQAALAACVTACLDCAQTCTACVDACLAGEDLVMLSRCIRLNLDCAAICLATAQVLSRQYEPDFYLLAKQLEACLAASFLCGRVQASWTSPTLPDLCGRLRSVRPGL